jgi:hypothetical protein
VSCPPESGGNGPTFWVNPGDNPGPEAVIAFVQPYVIAAQTLPLLPGSGGATSGLQNFHRRIGFYLQNDKIIGMRLIAK